jgi:DNA-binding HxlR family transcriptional regulator
MRPGVQVLSILAVPLNVEILQTLEAGPTLLPDLRREVGHPPVTTMRSYLRKLTELGAIERHREDDFPGSVSYMITRNGERILAVGEILQHWLEASPEGSIELGSTAAKSATKAFIDGWSASVVRALAARPLALTELDRFIPQVSYPTLERRLTAMRLVGLIEPSSEGDGRVTRYQVTPWLRTAVAPLTAAVGWERQCLGAKAPPPGRIGIEATFLLAVPLLDLPSEASGTCRLAVELRRGAELEFAGVMVRLEEGQLRSCVSRLEGQPDSWATGSLLDWLRWLRGLDGHQIELGGDTTLPNAMADAMRRVFMQASKI